MKKGPNMENEWREEIKWQGELLTSSYRKHISL